MAIDYAAMNKKAVDDQAAVDKLSVAKQATLDKQAYKGQRDLNSGRRRMQPGGNTGVLPQRIAPGGVEGTAASLGMKKGGKVKKFSGTAGSDVRVDANGNKIQDSEAPKDDPSFSQRLINTAFEPLGLFKSLKMKKGGSVKKFAKGGGIEVRGKTRGRIC